MLPQTRTSRPGRSRHAARRPEPADRDAAATLPADPNQPTGTQPPCCPQTRTGREVRPVGVRASLTQVAGGGEAGAGGGGLGYRDQGVVLDDGGAVDQEKF